MDPPPYTGKFTAQGITIERGGRRLLSALGFDLAAGEILVVSGRNAIGKSSLLRCIAGLVAPSLGQFLDNGIPLRAAKRRRLVVLVAQPLGLRSALSVGQTLEFETLLLNNQAAPETLRQGLHRFDLQAIAAMKIRQLSTGQRQRLALARLALSRRPLWLLDEPLAHLDRHGEQLLASLLAEHQDKGGAALITAPHPLMIARSRHLSLEHWAL